MQQRFLAPVLLVITALLWSLGGVLIKSIDWPPMAIAAGRSIAAIPVLLACAGRQRFTFSPAQVGGAIAYAATVALVVFLRKERTGSPINSIILGNIIVGIAGAPFLLRAPLLQARALWLVLALGVVQLGVSYALYAEAIKHVTALEAMLIPMIEPVL